ncbi:MAG: DUF2062 domain-containing protein [Rhodocyclaceae bacterium]
MRAFLRRWLPDPERLRTNRWLRWLGPALLAPQLWRLSRRSVALGVALGVFFGLLIPIAQIPLSAAAAIVLRANIPVAVTSTLVSNPVTYAPLYYVSYRLGSALIGGEAPRREAAPGAPRQAGFLGWLDYWWQRLAALGRPLLLGMAIMASTAGLAAWLLITWLWRLKVWWAWRQRQRQRR